MNRGDKASNNADAGTRTGMRRVWLLLGALALAGCEALPAAGPTAIEVSAEAAPTDEAGAPQDQSFALVAVDDGVISALAERRPPDFSDVFVTPGSGASFRIQRGDVVSVTLWESISGGLSGGLFIAGGGAEPSAAGGGGASGSSAVRIPSQVVGPSGRITIPFAGRVPVLQRTPEQVEADIVERLEGKAINPQAIVTVNKEASNLVSVIGDATSGDAVPLAPGADRITDVISRAGGL
ncbi:MAG: polysaccharide biosynthesis/export family protein, partial [Pseudomonadota bacterium]